MEMTQPASLRFLTSTAACFCASARVAVSTLRPARSRVVLSKRRPVQAGLGGGRSTLQTELAMVSRASSMLRAISVYWSRQPRFARLAFSGRASIVIHLVGNAVQGVRSANHLDLKLIGPFKNEADPYISGYRHQSSAKTKALSLSIAPSSAATSEERARTYTSPCSAIST